MTRIRETHEDSLISCINQPLAGSLPIAAPGLASKLLPNRSLQGAHFRNAWLAKAAVDALALLSGDRSTRAAYLFYFGEC